MKDLQLVQNPLMDFIPECYETIFIEKVLDEYWDGARFGMVYIHDLVRFIEDPLGFEIASFIETGGSDPEYYARLIENEKNPHWQYTLQVELSEAIYDGLYEDIESVLQFFRLTSMSYEDGVDFTHYCRQVW